MALDFLAVALHVFVDIFNAYGTQAIRPFSRKWVALGVINTFDPIIFSLHCLGIVLWAFGANPVWTFGIMYIIIVIYYMLRFAVQKAVKNAVHSTIQDEEYVIVAPTMRFFHWRIAAKSKTHYYVGGLMAGLLIFMINSKLNLYLKLPLFMQP